MVAGSSLTGHPRQTDTRGFRHDTHGSLARVHSARIDRPSGSLMSRHDRHSDDGFDDDPRSRSRSAPSPPDWCRGLLVAALVVLLLLPVVLSVIVGLGGLLRALDDRTAARACDWTALVIGAVWLTSLVATTVLTAVTALAPPPPPPPRRRRPRRRRRDRGSVESGGV